MIALNIFLEPGELLRVSQHNGTNLCLDDTERVFPLLDHKTVVMFIEEFGSACYVLTSEGIGWLFRDEIEQINVE